MAIAKPLVVLLVALAAAPASAGPIVPEAGRQTPAEAPAPPKAAAVDAPPVLPLFAGALALLGWRLGRRRRR